MDSMEKEIVSQLKRGCKTWTELEQNLKMSSRTLWKKLVALMEKGIVVKYGVVEHRKIVDYYSLRVQRQPEIVYKIPRMFEKGDWIFQVKIKDDLDMEQDLVWGINRHIVNLMHFARKTLNVKFAEDISPKQRIEYIDNWKREAKRYASEWIDSFIETIVLYSEPSWVKIFGEYESNPAPFYKALSKYADIIEEAHKREEEERAKVIRIHGKWQ